MLMFIMVSSCMYVGFIMVLLDLSWFIMVLPCITLFMLLFYLVFSPSFYPSILLSILLLVLTSSLGILRGLYFRRRPSLMARKIDNLMLRISNRLQGVLGGLAQHTQKEKSQRTSWEKIGKGKVNTVVRVYDDVVQRV